MSDDKWRPVLHLRPATAEDINVSYYIDLSCNSESHFFWSVPGVFGARFPRLPFSIPRRLSTLRIIAQEDKRNKLLMARGDSLDLSFPPDVIFYERRPRARVARLETSSLFRVHVPTYVYVYIHIYDFARAFIFMCMDSSILEARQHRLFWERESSLSTASVPPAVSRLSEIRAIGFVSNQGGNRVWFLAIVWFAAPRDARHSCHIRATRASTTSWIIFVREGNWIF